MGWFDFLKSNEEKVKELLDNNKIICDEIIFNNKIKTVSTKDMEIYSQQVIAQNTKYEDVKNQLDFFERYNDIVINVKQDFDHRLEKYGNMEIRKEFNLFSEKFQNVNELKSDYPNQVLKFEKQILKHYNNCQVIEETIFNIQKFNLYNQGLQAITEDIADMKPQFKEPEKTTNIMQICEKVDLYIEWVEYFKDFIEKKNHLPYIEDYNNIKNELLNSYKTNDYETFNIQVYNLFANNKPVLQELNKASNMIKDYQSDIREKLNDIKMQVSVNSSLEKLLEFEYEAFENYYKKTQEEYKSQALYYEDILDKYIKLNRKIDKLNNNYFELLTPLKNTISMLGINDEAVIIDINNYYIYSLAKSIESYLNIYGHSKNISANEVDYFIKMIENKLYILTNDQKNAIYEAINHLNMNKTANCLIQGDVSSGKTIVTATLMFITALKKQKSIYIVPRKILRKQHLDTLKEYNELFGLNLNIYDAAENFDPETADIILNGYSFSNKKLQEITFEMGVIDEIQLFGVEQRNEVQKYYPHIDMFYTTATPHPRTKLISLIGNMDIIEIRQLPPGRKLKKTEVFTKFNDHHEQIILEETRKKNTVLVVCPLVNKTGTNAFESIHTAHLKYQEIFPHLRIEKIHGNMSEEKRDDLILETVNGNVDILIATKTIEVGVDIPSASVIIIHHPYTMKIKWGASQLHQLRGRVGRNNQDSYCFIESPGNFKEKSPVGSVLKTQDVFQLTEDDFDWRGFEKIIGTKQSGKGSKQNSEKRIKAYEIIAKKTPKLIEQLDPEFVNKLENIIKENKIENLN